MHEAQLGLQRGPAGVAAYDALQPSVTTAEDAWGELRRRMEPLMTPCPPRNETASKEPPPLESPFPVALKALAQRVERLTSELRASLHRLEL